MLSTTRQFIVLTAFGVMSSLINLGATQSRGFAQFEAFVDFAKGLQTWGKDDAEIQFLKPHVNVELSFIKRVCEPTDQQMTAIVEAARLAYWGMNDLVQSQNARRVVRNANLMINVVGPNSERLTENPFVRIRDDAAKYLKPILKDDQYERYVKESGDRSRFERQAAIDIAVGLVDDKLVLSDQQRGQLTEKLLETWKTVDVQQMQMYLYNPQYAPSIDTASMDAVLTKKQMTAWRAQSTTNFSIHLGHEPDSGLGEDWLK